MESDRFPRAKKYPADWIADGAMGSNPLWLTEWLTEAMPLEPGMRVLDLGCGMARSSVFLAREFDVEVWAVDLWVPAADNWRRIRDEGLEGRVYPLHCDARSLPFAGEFFDAIVAVDCYSYFGTDDLFLNYLVNFVKPKGLLGVVGAGLMQEMTSPVPAHLSEMWTQDFWALHSPAWWRAHWEKTGLVDIETADHLPDGWRFWFEWQRNTWPDNTLEISTVEADRGRYLGYMRMAARRRPDVVLQPYCWPDNLRSFLEQKSQP